MEELTVSALDAASGALALVGFFTFLVMAFLAVVTGGLKKENVDKPQSWLFLIGIGFFLYTVAVALVIQAFQHWQYVP